MKNIELTQSNQDNLAAFKALLNKDENKIINEALEFLLYRRSAET